MPSLQTYKEMLGSHTNGEAHKIESDMVMEETWYDDIQTRLAYFYDYEHDAHPRQFEGLTPADDIDKIPITIKYIENSSQTLNKDAVSYHIMFRPSQDLNVVDYYKKNYEERWGATFPCGLYVDIPDYRGVYNRWLVVGMAQSNNAQFPTYEILRVNYLFTWIYNRTKYQMAGVQRSQNSYNSGIWTDYIFTTPNDVIKFYLPMNEVTSKLTYNQRIIVDTKVNVANGDIPRVWQISKLSRTTPHGIGVYTGDQDVWDPNRDYIEYGVEGDPSTITGMYADYYGENIPEDFLDEHPINPDKHIDIVYTGVSQTLKVGGSSKKLTALFYRGEEQLAYEDGTWTYEVDGIDIKARGLIGENFSGLDPNQVRINFYNDSKSNPNYISGDPNYVGTDYVGKVLTITYTATSGVVGTLQLNIAGL